MERQAGYNSEQGGEDSHRRIVHVDMDAFYAAIEQRDFPEKYAGEPIAVGGTPPRGVVQTASYEARPYGVHSAQAAVEADRKCPDLIFVSPRMDVYKEESQSIRKILFRYTDLVEPLSLDEAYLDVTEPKKGPRSGTLIARRIRREIQEKTGLTASAGVGPSKFVAKVASDRDKPDGLTVVTPEEQMAFIAELPIEDFHGIGPVTAEKMNEMGIQAGKDLQERPERELRKHFGKRGAHFKKLAMGEDDRPVKPNRERKSVGAERTFREDISDPEEMLRRLETIAEKVERRLKGAGPEGGPACGRTVTLKLKSHEHEISTRQTTLERAVSEKEKLCALAERLLHRPRPPAEPVRLLGLSVSTLTSPTSHAGQQLELEFP
ncbi:DNA polymerase IV [Salinibacter sp. 10B]|uniref:DNA polymerase IV n=1 Tax=Salinibacter sp. 10B TaxID=1923971 RepID=UPI000CF54A41|nr:DNA polymerase IV [Salinibacter sp. 10B]PQJ36831.1 DNA polymerase IV [Salinibacter sp. 10B]